MKRKNLMPKFTMPSRVKKTQEFYKLKHPEQDVKILFLGHGIRGCDIHLGCLLSYQNLPYISNNVSIEEIFDQIIKQFGKDRIQKRGETNKRNILKFSSSIFNESFNQKFFSAMSLLEQNNLNVESYSFACCCGISNSISRCLADINNVTFNYSCLGVSDNMYRSANKNFRHFSVTSKKTSQQYIYGEDTDYLAIEPSTQNSFKIVV
jgi:hypothetical protein